jgi:thioester reductase-like protein
MVNLFALVAVGASSMRVLFISSVGAVSAGSVNLGPAPKSVIRSLDTRHANGYSQSKFMSELLCDAAHEHLGIAVSIARVDQVAGPVGVGAWNHAERLPSLVISSVHLGYRPEDLGPQFSEVDWIPSDLLADIVVDLAVLPTPETTGGSDVFNLRNPNTTTWDALLPSVKDAVYAHLGKTLDIVPSSTWLERLEGSSELDTQEVASFVVSNPGIKLMTFYRDGL